MKLKNWLLFFLGLLLCFSAQAQFYNAHEYRFVYKASMDTTGIAGIGQMRWDAVTGKFRCWNGTSWYDCHRGGSGGVSDGDKGDITVSGSGTVWNIDAGTIAATELATNAVTTIDITDANVTFAKIENGSALSVLGRSANSVGVMASIAAGSDGHVLRRSGTTLGFGTVANAGLTNSTIAFATGTSGTDVAWGSSPISLGGTATLNIPDASASARGVVTTGAQTFAGNKIFNGDVGIGGTPTTKFWVSDAGNTTADRARFQFTSPSVAMYIQQDGAGDLLEIANSTASQFTITNAGDVGIGTSPSAKLDIYDASGVDLIRLQGNSGVASEEFIVKVDGTQLTIYNVTNSTQPRINLSSTDMEIFAGTGSTNAANKLFILESQITGSPAAGIGASMAFQVETTAGVEEGGLFEVVTTDVSSGSEDFDFVMKNMAAGAAAAEKFRFASTGTGTGTDWVATSDRRLKKNIRSVNNSLRQRISSIADLVRNYDRTDTKKNETGFIAQELAKEAPEYVMIPEDTTAMQAVNYAKMVVPLYKGVDELYREIDDLKKQITELKAMLK